MKGNISNFKVNKVLVFELSQFRSFRVLLNSIIFVGFASCASDFPASVSERSEVMVIRNPIIVTNSEFETNDRLISKSTNTSLDVPNQRTYTVQRGDNLISIAFRYDLDFRSLAITNQLRPPYTIFVDQELNLDIRNIPQTQSKRNNRLGVNAPSNSVARTQGASSQSGGIMRESIDNGSGEKIWEWPSSGNILNKFSPGLNKGIDIGGRLGDPVFAVSKGEVVYSGRDDVQGIGNLLIIRHGDRYLSAYGHNSRMLVTEGDSVGPGQKIAEIGSDMDGNPVLHFEIRFDGKPTDPLKVLPRR